MEERCFFQHGKAGRASELVGIEIQYFMTQSVPEHMCPRVHLTSRLPGFITHNHLRLFPFLCEASQRLVAELAHIATSHAVAAFVVDAVQVWIRSVNEALEQIYQLLRRELVTDLYALSGKVACQPIIDGAWNVLG
jgi:hypothetical protein